MLGTQPDALSGDPSVGAHAGSAVVPPCPTGRTAGLAPPGSADRSSCQEPPYSGIRVPGLESPPQPIHRCGYHIGAMCRTRICHNPPRSAVPAHINRAPYVYPSPTSPSSTGIFKWPTSVPTDPPGPFNGISTTASCALKPASTTGTVLSSSVLRGSLSVLSSFHPSSKVTGKCT